MRKNKLPSPADLSELWAEATGDDAREVRQRAVKLRIAGLMPDFVNQTRG